MVLTRREKILWKINSLGDEFGYQDADRLMLSLSKWCDEEKIRITDLELYLLIGDVVKYHRTIHEVKQY